MPTTIYMVFGKNSVEREMPYCYNNKSACFASLKYHIEVKRMNVSYVLAADGSMILEGLKNMVVVLAVVFTILILLSIIIWTFKFLGKIGGGNSAAKSISAPAGAPAPSAPAGSAGSMSETDVEFKDVDAETAAVILGAMASELGSGFSVTSIKKSK